MATIGDREWEIVFVSQPPWNSEGVSGVVMLDQAARRIEVCKRCCVEQVSRGLAAVFEAGFGCAQQREAGRPVDSGGGRETDPADHWLPPERRESIPDDYWDDRGEDWKRHGDDREGVDHGDQ